MSASSPKYDWFFRRHLPRLLRHAPVDDHRTVLASVRRVADQMLAAAAPAHGSRWQTAPLLPIASLRSAGLVHRDVRVVAHIAECKTPQHLVLDGGIDAIATSLVLVDSDEDRISTLDLVGEDEVTAARNAFRRGCLVEVLGRVALTQPRGQHRSDYVLAVKDLRPTSSILDLIGATQTDRDVANGRLRELAANGVSPYEYLEQMLIEKLQLVGLDDYPLLRLVLLDFPILQAHSGGRVARAPGKIHGELIGPPGSGKKIASIIAGVVNPRVGEASASKFSVAGLIGTSHRAADGWVSEPGLIPLAHEGVVTLQDAHAITPGKAAQLGPLLQELLEDGVLRDAKAGGMRREVSVGVLVDLNRKSQLQSYGGAPEKEAALAILRPLTSRLDLVAEIPVDAKRAWKIGAQISVTQTAGFKRLNDEAWVREVRVLVATLRDRHAVVDLEPARPLIQRVFDEIAAKNEVLIEQDPSTGDLPARLMLSLHKMTAASARAHDRSVADEQDVTVAAEFARIKLESLRMRAPDHEEVAAAAEEVRRAYYAQHAGAVVKAEDIAKSYRETTGDDISPRTVRRDLKKLGAKQVSKGLWQVPPGSSNGAAS